MTSCCPRTAAGLRARSWSYTRWGERGGQTAQCLATKGSGRGKMRCLGSEGSGDATQGKGGVYTGGTVEGAGAKGDVSPAGQARRS